MPPGDTAALGKGTRTALSSSGTNGDGPGGPRARDPPSVQGHRPHPWSGNEIPQGATEDPPGLKDTRSRVPQPTQPSEYFLKKTQHPGAQAAPRECNTVAVPVPDTGGGGEAEGSWLREAG